MAPRKQAKPLVVGAVQQRGTSLTAPEGMPVGQGQRRATLLM